MDARSFVFVAALVSSSGCRPATATLHEDAAPRASTAPVAVPTAETKAPSAPAVVPPDVKTDWCIEGVKALAEDVCYVLPDLPKDQPRRLLVYLHGITPDLPSSPQKENVQTAVMHAALRARAAAIVPRGRRGIGPRGARDWWAWPTSPKTHAELAAAIIAQLARAKKQLEDVVGAPFERTYLAGSSNGAYFVTALALSGDLERLGLDVQGVGAMSGGSTGGRLPTGEPRRVYVGFGSYDEESKNNGRALARVLEGARWPVKVAEHPFGHGAREVYLDEAFAFWDARGP